MRHATQACVLALALAVALLPLAGCSSQPKEALYTIGVFQFSNNVVLDRTREGFLQAMGDAGYKD